MSTHRKWGVVSERSALPLNGRDFRSAILGEQIVERFRHQVLDRGFAIDGKGPELPGDVFRKVRRDLLCSDAGARASSNGRLSWLGDLWLRHFGGAPSAACGGGDCRQVGAL